MHGLTGAVYYYSHWGFNCQTESLNWDGRDHTTVYTEENKQDIKLSSNSLIKPSINSKGERDYGKRSQRCKNGYYDRRCARKTYWIEENIQVSRYECDIKMIQNFCSTLVFDLQDQTQINSRWRWPFVKVRRLGSHRSWHHHYLLLLYYRQGSNHSVRG